MEESHQYLPQEDTIIKCTIIELFEEALNFRVSRSMEEDVAPLRSNTLPLGGMRSTRSSSMRYTNHEDTRKSHPFHHDAQLIHPPHHHTL
jgi:hypothetical protein